MGEENRRHHRLGVALEMQVRGKDCYGEPFDEATSSDDVSRGGCSFDTTHEVELGAELDLEILRRFAARRPPTPFLTTGVAVRVVAQQQDQYRVSVRFTGPQFPVFSSEGTG